MKSQELQPITFGFWLKRRIKVVCKKTIVQFSQDVGVTEQTVHNWIRGNSIPNLDPNQYANFCQSIAVKPFELQAAFLGKMGAAELQKE